METGVQLVKSGVQKVGAHLTLFSFPLTFSMVSCGRDNIRLWRLKDGTLRSAPVSLGEYHSMDFTDVCFESSYLAKKNPEDKLM